MYKHLRATGLVLMSLIAVETGFFGAAQAGEFAFESVRLRGGRAEGHHSGRNGRAILIRSTLLRRFDFPGRKTSAAGGCSAPECSLRSARSGEPMKPTGS